jgi:hypothetical protein
MGKYVKSLENKSGTGGFFVAVVGRDGLWMKFELISVDLYFPLVRSRYLRQNCSNDMKTCKTCHNFQWCLSLCMGAAAYASQDEVNQRELLIGIPRYSPPFLLSHHRFPSQRVWGNGNKVFITQIYYGIRNVIVFVALKNGARSSVFSR